MQKRAGQSNNQASYEWEQGMKIINKLKADGAYSLTFFDLQMTQREFLMIYNLLEIKFLKDRMLEEFKYNFVYPQESITEYLEMQPLVAAGALGSGTRVIAQILINLGINLGGVNEPNDNLIFTALFKSPKWYKLSHQKEFK